MLAEADLKHPGIFWFIARIQSHEGTTVRFGSFMAFFFNKKMKGGIKANLPGVSKKQFGGGGFLRQEIEPPPP